MATLALIGLGSNLGRRSAQLDAAVAALAEIPGTTLKKVSRYHETPPVGGPQGQGPFLNAAAALETTLAPDAMLAALHTIEHRSGRVRSERWAERTLDLDLLLFGATVSDAPDLRIPHPRMAVRRFVLAPLVEVAPQAVDPLTGRTVAALLANLDRRPSCLIVLGPSSRALCGRLVNRLPGAGLFAENDPERAREQILAQRTIELDIDRWPAAVWGERWIVTDLWFDQIYCDALIGIADNPDAWRQRFLEARARLLAPTFLAATSADTYRQLRLWRERNAHSYPIGGDVPILGPGTGTAAPGSDPSPEDLDRMEEEIVAACTATRAG